MIPALHDYPLEPKITKYGDLLYLYIYCAPGPLTALASSPGAGNTWARYLIQQFTGFVTGAIYNDKALRKTDFPGEKFFDGRVIVIKTHETT